MGVQSKAVAQILDALATNPGKDLILYCCTNYAQAIVAELREKGIQPLCICDSNPALHGSLFSDLEVISIDCASERFDDFMLFVANDFKLNAILYQLLESGKVEKHQIINYVPVVKRKGCLFMNHIRVCENDLLFCCGKETESTGRIFERNKMPTIKNTSDLPNYETLIDEIIALREQIMHDLENGIPCVCTGCVYVSDIYVTEKCKFSFLSWVGVDYCNFRCLNCAGFKSDVNRSKYIDFCVISDALSRRGLIDASTTIGLTNGEITVHPKRREVYKLCEKFINVMIFTNAYIYDESIAFMCSQGARIHVDMSAGTPETFAKIKGVDALEHVKDNLLKYAVVSSDSGINIKYIIFCGINDSVEEIDAFFNLIADLRIKMLSITHDICEEISNPEVVTKLVRHFEGKAKELSIPCSTTSLRLHKLTDIFFNI